MSSRIPDNSRLFTTLIIEVSSDVFASILQIHRQLFTMFNSYIAKNGTQMRHKGNVVLAALVVHRVALALQVVWAVPSVAGSVSIRLPRAGATRSDDLMQCSPHACNK